MRRTRTEPRIALAEAEQLLDRLLQAQPELLHRERELIGRAAAAGLPVRPLGLAPLFSPARRICGADCDWLVFNAAHDPLLRHRDGFPVPREQLRTLRALRRAQIDVDAIYLAHAVPHGAAAASVVPPPARRALHTAGRIGALSRTIWALATMPLLAGGALAGAASFQSARGLDPLVLGAVVAPGEPIGPGTLGAWLLLAQWAYDAEVEP